VISQAFLTASKNDDFVAMTGQYSYIGAEVNFAALQSQFKIIKQCTNASLGCWNTSGESWRQEDSTAPAFIDSSGMAWKLRYHDTVGLVPAILVDTNGSKAPNQYGEDRFVFLFSCYSFFIWAPPDDMGIPTKIIPFSDITNPPASDFIINCPSVAKHACYNTSWLLGN